MWMKTSVPGLFTALPACWQVNFVSDTFTSKEIPRKDRKGSSQKKRELQLLHT
jgi:hypothetical protein